MTQDMSNKITTTYTSRLFFYISLIVKIMAVIYILSSVFISMQLYTKFNYLKTNEPARSEGALIAQIEANKKLTGNTYIDNHFIQEIDKEATVLQTLTKNKEKDYSSSILLYMFITIGSALILILSLLSVDKLLRSLEEKHYFETQHPATLKHVAILLLILAFIRGVFALELQITLPLISTFLFLLADIFEKGSELEEEVNLTI